jgi:hypothetical protein
MKICFTTSLFGDLSTLDRPAKFNRVNNCDYILFTDSDIAIESSWDIINVKNHPIISSVTSSIKKSRYPKFLSWEILSSIGKKYDMIYYCDSCFYPNPNGDWGGLSSQIVNHSGFSFIQTVHQTPDVRNGGILAEMALIIDNKRDSLESMQNTQKVFDEIDHTISLRQPQYYENTCFGFCFNDQIVRDITTEFWSIYSKPEVTYRDQPLWNFLLLKNKLTPLIKNDFKYNTNNFINELSWFIFCPDNLGVMRDKYL